MLRLPACLSLLLVTLAGCSSPPAVAPDQWATYESTDNMKTFVCDYPEGWNLKGGGKQNAYVKISQGSAMIEARTDVTGSLLGDIANNAPLGMGGDLFGGGEMPADLEPVAQVHQFGLKDAEVKFGKYVESEASELDVVLGPARYSEFVAGSKHGYRATILQLDRRVTVYCSCRESDWETLAPGFRKVLQSFRR